MIDWVSKLTSRKFWAAIASFVSMLVIAFGGTENAATQIIAFGGTENAATQITALIMAGASVIAYIIGEGLIDAAGAKTAADEVWIADEEPPSEEENG